MEVRCGEIIKSVDNTKAAKLFVVKICNYDLLSTLLSDSELEMMMSEVDTLILHLLQKFGYSDTTELVREKEYIAFVIYYPKLFSVYEFAYLIYSGLQLYPSKVHQSVILQCRLTSAELAPEMNPVKGLLCTLANQAISGYYVEFDPEICAKTTVLYTELREFQDVLDNQSLSFAYQPIIERATGDIPYYECLLRIHNRHSEIVSVGPFIQLAEGVGLNNVVDHIVLKMAANELYAAHNISLSVNISNRGVLDQHLLYLAKDLLSDRSVAERLIIEITETSLNMDFDHTKRFTDSLRNMGCRIALDDFGTGFTSFKQLQNLSIDIIKIDGSFIRGIAHNQRNQHLVLALMTIAEQIGAKTVAEFVETGEIAKFLLDAKIDYMQGNFFSPALNYRSWDKN